MHNTALKEAFKRSGIIGENDKIVVPIKRHRPNRRPTRAQQRAQEERASLGKQ